MKNFTWNDVAKIMVVVFTLTGLLGTYHHDFFTMSWGYSVAAGITLIAGFFYEIRH
jgi:nitric oxide reductase large subunit